MLKWGGTPLFDASERTHRRQDNLGAAIAQFATRSKIACWKTRLMEKKNPLDRLAFHSQRSPSRGFFENGLFFALSSLPYRSLRLNAS
jgi:hypothetical protein